MVPSGLVRGLALALLLCVPALAGSGKQAPPQHVLWSWFAADDFRPMAGQPVGVGYLALSLGLAGRDQVTPSLRAVPVRIPPGMYRMAVVRIDIPYAPQERPAFSVRQRELAARMIGEIVEIARPQGLQIDFDAPESARPFYRQLLADVRRRIGPDLFLSITALMSWCDSERSWMAGLPVDEMVPMAFSMGPGTGPALTLLRRGPLPFAGCRGSLGVQFVSDHLVGILATEEAVVRPRMGQRGYFFAGGDTWTPALVKRALTEVSR